MDKDNSYELHLRRIARKLTPETFDEIVTLLSKVFEDKNSPLNADAQKILEDLDIIYTETIDKEIFGGSKVYRDE